MKNTYIRRALAAATTAILVAAAGCTDESADTTTTTAADTSSTSVDLPEGVNQADVVFAQGMIPHHQQAIEMSDMVVENGDDAEVAELAEQMKAAQGPEIEQMQGWLADWGVDESTGNGPGMNGSGMNGSGMDGSMGPGMNGSMGAGMMSDDEMGAMSDMMGADLDEMFLTMMIRHHEGAIEMSRVELDDGENADVMGLAQSIIDAQQLEIEKMRSMLESG